jgi:hypothetical protein
MIIATNICKGNSFLGLEFQISVRNAQTNPRYSNCKWSRYSEVEKN